MGIEGWSELIYRYEVFDTTGKLIGAGPTTLRGWGYHVADFQTLVATAILVVTTTI